MDASSASIGLFRAYSGFLVYLGLHSSEVNRLVRCAFRLSVGWERMIGMW